MGTSSPIRGHVISAKFASLFVLIISLLSPGSLASMSHPCTGAPMFQSSQKIVIGQTPVAVVAGDFDGDGRPDLAVANSGSNDVSILLANRGHGLTVVTSVPVGDGPRALAAGDLNADGTVDLVVANSISNNVSILLGEGNGRFRAAKTCPVGTEPVALVLGDFNRDGKLDLATANSKSN